MSTLVTTTCNRCGQQIQVYAGAVSQCPYCGNQGSLPAGPPVAAPLGYAQPSQQIIVVQHQRPPKDTGVAYLLWFFLGLWGAHKFYLGQTGMGVAYIFTLGLCGIGLLVDLFTLPDQVRKANGQG